MATYPHLHSIVRNSKAGSLETAAVPYLLEVWLADYARRCLIRPLASGTERTTMLSMISPRERIMAQLLVRDVDEDLVAALKRRAASHGRSAEAEHRAILGENLLSSKPKKTAIQRGSCLDAVLRR